jgi:hypothetical protein
VLACAFKVITRLITWTITDIPGVDDHVSNVLIELLGGVRIACSLKLTSTP